ncbi:MAG: T9SS type A sorting domain-containing protein [Lewinellaceae bacterium]|nr:T9SS type A sorting domain-containing protein [Lewinellaceae bacterium]
MTDQYTEGELFVNYGSAVNAYSIRNRSDYTVGEPAVGYSISQQWNTYLGYWSRLLVPPLPAIVTATQGDLLDRIRLSWAINVLGSYPAEGFNLYRDGFFLGYVGPNVRTYNDFNVIAGRPYTYEVRGVNQYGEGSGGKAIGFQVPNGTVTGRIQTISGRPVQDALVTLTPLQGFSAKFDPGEGAFAMSNKTGAADTLVPLNNGEWTLSFWVKTTLAAANAGILAFHPFPLTIRPIQSSTGHEGIEVAQTGNSAALLSGQFPDSIKNDWNHVALTVDTDGKGRLYINGQLVVIGDLPPLTSADELRLGARTGASGNWTGFLDELRIYHRRLDELDLGEAGMGTASSLTPGLKYYWKMDEELGTGSFDLLQRNKLYFCGASFDPDRPYVRTMGKSDSEGFYRIESASYGTGITFLAEPMKDFYMYRALKFVRSDADYATLPDFALSPKSTLELWVNSAGPDGTQCLLSKKWSGNDFRVLLEPNGVLNELKIYLNGAEHNFGNLGLGYQHLAFTIDSSGTDRTITAYKNGQPFGAPHTFGGVSGNWSNPAGAWVLGARESGGYTDHFGGLIDEVAVYDTTLNADSINSHYLKARNMQEPGLRIYFNLDEGNGNRLNNSGSVLLPFGTNNGAEWSPFAARQATSPHVFTPNNRQVTLNPSITSVDQVDFIDRSTVPVTGYVRYQNTDCFAKNVEILVNGASFSPKVLTDSTGKFTIEFDPGTTATLTPVFPDTAKTAEADVPHVFTPGFWDVTNVNNPIAGIVFNDVTTRTVRGLVAGGSKAGCNKSIIKAPPGQGQGTVCVVKVRSTDGCFERQIVLDNQEGEYEFAELPPLESLTVAVVEHSDPDIKAAFQTAGGSTVNLTLKDTVINFIYIAPPEVEIVSGLTPIGACSDIVLEKGENIQLEIKLKEVYVPIVDNMGMVLDDGVCYLDTADFNIINGLSDTELDTAMGQGKLRYKFKVGDPNPSPPYLKTLQIIGTSLAGRIGSLSVQVIVTGIRNKAATFTTVSPPQIPTIILRDPPGDASYAYLEKDTTVCKTTAMSFDFEVGGGGGVEAHLGGAVQIVAAPLGVGTIGESGPIVDINTEFQVTYQKIESNAFQTCLSMSSRLSTSSSDRFIGANGDVYLGEAWNIIFGFADQVSFNATTCTPGISTLLVVQPDSFPTVFMYTQYQVKNFVMRYLDSLMIDPMATPDQVASYATSKARWQQILDRNAGLKEKAPLKRNISFDAGIEYEYSETSDTTDSETVEELVNSEQSLTTHFGFEFNEAGVVGMLKFVSGTSDSDSEGSENSRGVTTGYVLADNDEGDAFSVDVAIDSAYNTPVFRLKAGQSSCPWEKGTANRDAPNLQLDEGSQFTAVNVPADEPAVFKLSLGNLSATNEDRMYSLTANPANNPDGAVISVNGQELNSNTTPYFVPNGTSIPITLTVERGPVAYEYENLQVALVAFCELEYRYFDYSVSDPDDAKFISIFNLGVDFIRPCSEVAVNVPEQNWVVLNNDPIQPGTIRRITVSGYDLNSPDFQLVRVQYRRSDGDGAWINLPPPAGGKFEAFNPRWSGFYNTQADTFRIPGSDTLLLGSDFTNFFWETAGIGDGPYEVHAWAVCTGDASDKPGFSEIIKGRIDREPPSIVGVPQPSDGVYQVGDEISFTFNQHINCSKLVPPVGKVELFDATTDELIDVNASCFENKIVLDPNFPNKDYENKILRAELNGIEDLVGNAFNGTKLNKGVWEFYVDRNELGWLTDSVGLTKYEDETKTVTANIHNRGGYHVPFKILEVPDWVQVVPNQGTLAPNESRAISFTVNNTVAFGHWADSIVLETQTGQNPFFMGGSEPLPVGARVVCRPPYLPVNLAQYENTMSMVLKLNIENVFSEDPEDIVAAYINDEFRGMAKVQFVPQVGAWLAYLTVYGNPADLLKPIRLEVWDASMCQRYSSVIEPFTYQPDNVIGITDDPQVVHTAGLLMREVPINFGWNWLSFNLAFPNNSLNTALASLKHSNGSLMRSQTTFATNSGGAWFGPLTQLNNTKMFIYRSDMPDTLRMQGTPIDPATTPIPVVVGWNWIGYVPDYSLPVNEALASVPATYGDVVKSQYAFAQYLNPTFGWVGNLKYMMPPNGYQLKLAQAGTLTYPPPPAPFGENQTEARGETEPLAAHWNVDPTQYEHSSTLIGMIRSNGANATTSDMELGVFVGNEVRGTAQAIYIEPLDAHLFFLTMYANTPGELLRFKLYDDATETVQDLKETMFFAPNQHQGGIENPVPFELQTTSAGEDFAAALGFDVQPNPFSSETTLRFNLPKAEEVTLTISDAQGREVVRRPLSAAAGPNTLTWNGRSDTGSWLSSGVYMVRLQTDMGSASKKVVLQRLP